MAAEQQTHKSAISRAVESVSGMLPARLKTMWSTGQNGPVNPTWPMDYWQRGYDLNQHYGGMTSVVEACVDVSAKTVAMTKPQVWKDRRDGGRDLLPNSPLTIILYSPNSFQTTSDFMLNLVHSLLKTGNAYVYFDDYDGPNPTTMYLLNPRLTRAHRDRETGDVFYSVSDRDWYTLDTIEQSALVPSRRIMHVKLNTPYDPLLGVSPIESIALSTSTYNAIMLHESRFFQNMSRPSGVLSTDQTLNKDQIAMLRAHWNAQSKDLNTGGVPILASGLKWESLSINSQDAQLIEALKMTIRDISRAFQIPLQMINADDGTPFANVEALINFWLSTGLGFLLEHIEQSFNKAFRLPAGTYMNLDTSVLLRSDMKTRINTLGEAIMKGVYSPNEARALESLPAVEYGDEPRVQQQVVPLSYYSVLLEKELAAISAGASAEEEPPVDPDDTNDTNDDPDDTNDDPDDTNNQDDSDDTDTRSADDLAAQLITIKERYVA